MLTIIKHIVVLILTQFLFVSCVTNVCYNKKHKNLNSTLTIKVVYQNTNMPAQDVSVELWREKWPILSIRQSITVEKENTNPSGEVLFKVNNETNYLVYAYDSLTNMSGYGEYRFNEIEDSIKKGVVFIK